MNKICTTIKQSKKLIELGLDVNTADMMWTYDFTVGVINELNVISEQLKPEENDIPAWSFNALLKLMPMRGSSTPKLCKSFFASEPKERYHIGYFPEYFTADYDNPLDAAFELIIWLLENKGV